MLKTIQVQSGETLSGIAQRELGSASRWQELGYAGDPTKLQIGTTLTIPDQQPPTPVYQPPKPQEEIIKQQIAEKQQQIKDITDNLAKATAAGIGQGEEIPDWVLSAKLEDIPKIKAQKKIEELLTAAYGVNPKDYETIYNEKYTASELPTLKTQIDALDKKIANRKNDLNTAEAGISDNPWLSESSRVGQVKRLYDVAQKDINNLLDERKILADQYSAGITQIEKFTSESLAGIKTAQELQQKQIADLEKQQAGQEIKTQFVEVGGKRLLVNSVTGETIKDLGSTTSATDWETKRLTPSEAIDYGVPLGTTWKEVADRGIVPARYKAETTKIDEPLNILDVQRYNEIYPDAGIVAGDTETTAIQKVLQTITPRDYNDDELRSVINEVKIANKTYDEALTAINSVAQIKNKDRAIAIANEIYGKKQAGNFGQAVSETAQGLKIVAGETGQSIQEGTKSFLGQQIFDFLFQSQRNK